MSETRTPRPAPSPPRWPYVLRAAGLTVGVGLAAAGLAFVVRGQARELAAVDRSAITAGTDLARADPALRQALLVWQEAFQAKWVNLAAAGVCGWVWLARPAYRSRAVWALVTLLVTWNLGLLIKLVVRRARPVVADSLETAPGYSFPSGHAANTAAAALTLTLLLWPVLGPRGRVAVPVVGGVAVVVTCVDRVLLGVHYPSDVVGGVVIGCAMVGASYLGYRGAFVEVRPSSGPVGATS